jgi:diguanylate cyclase (GGDEF)-like protein
MPKFLLTCLLLAFAGANPIGTAFAAAPIFDVHVFDAKQAPSPVTAAELQRGVVNGRLDTYFKPFDAREFAAQAGSYWIKLRSLEGFKPANAATFHVRKNRQTTVSAFVVHNGEIGPLQLVTETPGFRSLQDAVFLLPNGLAADERIYLRVDTSVPGATLNFSTATLPAVLKNASEHARMITMAFGALLAMSLSALLIWLVLAEKLVLLYGLLFSLQAVYIAYLSGQGFEWPVLSALLPLEAYTSKVPAGLSGAIACLFIREIAELQRFSPRVYKVFGWMAIAFVTVTIANVAHEFGWGGIVAMAGNLLFIVSGIFTLVIAFLAWRRNNRAAGWFLLAWALLETFTIATALRLLLGDPENSATLLYYGLPLSMIAAAVLVALGVADRLREQRLALNDAERRAQIDPLTGVLNRASLADRLEAACARAQARGLPLALLFIDLDHFKQINDTYGHAAGDACLRSIIAPIQTELRHSDVIGRYGGEEFVVLLSSADIASAHPIAERIRKRVSEVTIDGFGKPIQITCSIGIASSDMLGIWGEQLITRADQAVYEAKRSGRNRVQIAEPVAA